MTSLLYPDHGGSHDNKAVLRNAVIFATGQRSFAASRILDMPLDDASFIIRSFAAVEAYSAKALALEDLLGWTLVLRNWTPFAMEQSLWVLLDKTQINKDSENELSVWAEKATPEVFRAALHIPPSEDMIEAGVEEKVVQRVDGAIQANIDGLRRAIDFRSRNDRRFVVGYNKIKHHLLGFPRPDLEQVHFPRFKGEIMETDGTRTIAAQVARVSTTAADVRQVASEAIAVQAILNSLLNLILLIRYQDAVETPGWVLRSIDLPGWFTDETPA